MTETVPEAHTNDHPKADHAYIRSILFEDHSTIEDDQFPVHVTGRIYIDGEMYPWVNPRLGWSVAGGSTDGTLVRFYVSADQVEQPVFDPDEERSGVTEKRFKIGGRECLTPMVVVRGGSQNPLVDNMWKTVQDVNGFLWTEVVLFVAEVHVRGRRDTNSGTVAP